MPQHQGRTNDGGAHDERKRHQPEGALERVDHDSLAKSVKDSHHERSFGMPLCSPIV
jgi:hypothetical protein